VSINFLNVARSFEVNASITEWDIRRAGLNIIKVYQLLPQDKIKELEKLPKLECDVKIGKMQISDREFSKALEQKFTDVMREFMKVNEIDEDFDVLSIKKDACFIINKKITISEFGKYIKFIPKNTYHAYIYLKPYEMYFKRDGEVDIKGLVGDKATRNKLLELHKDGIMNFIEYVIELAETTNMDSNKMNEFLHDFVDMYKKRELEFDYYREFNVESRFRYQMLGSEIMADYVDESMLENVNIEFNYKTLVLPLINLIC